MQPPSGLGAFNKIEEGSALFPFPLTAWSDRDQDDGAVASKVRPWRCCSSFRKVQRIREHRRKEGKEEGGGARGEGEEG